MMKKSRDKYVVQEFDWAARSYDESRIVKSYQRRAQILVISKMHIRKGMNVLDLGCGTGSGAIDVALQLEGTGEVIGIDLSTKMIEKAKQKLAGFQYNNVEFTVGSGGSIDYVDYFDYVLSTNAFHHFEKKEEIFSEVWKSLKHNGTFVVQDICDDYLLMKLVDLAGKVDERAHVSSATSQSLRNLFVSAGFTDVAVDRVRFNWFWRIMIGSGIKRSSS